MSDLSEVLPHFDQKPWKHLTFSLDKKKISTAELITRDPKWLAKHIPLPLKDVERMAKAVTRALNEDLMSKTKFVFPKLQSDNKDALRARKLPTRTDFAASNHHFITSLDPNVDAFLGGGIPVGYVTEIVGESATGKSQFAHALLLAATLKPPYGLGKAACYLTTEDDLKTTRLEQMLNTNPLFENMSKDQLPNLDQIFTFKINTLTEQESVLVHRLRPEIQRRNIGLVIIDSITAHFRAHFGGNNPKVLAARAVELQYLGKALRKLAHEHQVAVIVTNQVSDRFMDDIKSGRGRNTITMTAENPNKMSISTNQTQPKHYSQPRQDDLLTLDHQQMFFTGWGDDLSDNIGTMKTPALGLTWTNQLDARIVLKIDAKTLNNVSVTALSNTSRVRLMKMVFAPWTTPSSVPLQYDLRIQGLVGIPKNESGRKEANCNDGTQNSIHEEVSQFLDPKYWDDINLDEL